MWLHFVQQCIQPGINKNSYLFSEPDSEWSFFYFLNFREASLVQNEKHSCVVSSSVELHLDS